MGVPGQADRVARWMLAMLLVAAVFALNYRFVLTHFTRGSDLFDTGWFAWIMASGDPWLASPRSVGELSYFNYHLAPYLSAVSLLFHETGLDRFTALALHQGLVFALLGAALCGLVLAAWRGLPSALLFLAIAIFVLCGDVMLQITSFPHFEVAIPAFCLLGVALWHNDHRTAAALSFAAACLVREDGGLYAAAFLFALALLRPLGPRTLASPEARLGLAAILVSLLMFGIKGSFFPGFDTFGTNYSGQAWAHLTPDALRVRLTTFLGNPHALTSLLPALLLAFASWRYAVLALFMAPLILAQLLAARTPLWAFHAYYAMPFLVIWAGMVLTAADRARAGRLRPIEPLVLLVFALVGSGPFLYAVRPPAWFPVAAAAIARPVADLPELAATLERDVADVPRACVSMGVAALIPDGFAPEQVIDPASDLDRCPTLFLYKRDGHYAALSWRAVFRTRGPLVAGRVERYDQRP